MQYSKGWQGVRWAVSDENADTLIYKVEIRGEKEQTWKLMRDKVREKYFSFDTQAFPDGDYRIRITASDSPSNTPENTLTTQEESDPFTIDNTPAAHHESRGKGPDGRLARGRQTSARSSRLSIRSMAATGRWSIR